MLMDVWTNKHNVLPHFAIRISTIIDWEYHTVTIAVQPIESHTAKSLLKFVKKILAKFLAIEHDLSNFFYTADRAVNMLKLS